MNSKGSEIYSWISGPHRQFVVDVTARTDFNRFRCQVSDFLVTISET